MHGHRATVVWMHDDALAAKVTADDLGCRYISGPPNEEQTLRTAGVVQAESIMVLSEDDQLNLQVALKARDVNPNIRIVMRQFSRTLGLKIERNLENCSVLSLASHSAAAFAAASIDPRCDGALQFPAPGGVLTAFATRTATQFGIAGLLAAHAQRRIGARIVACNGSPGVPLTQKLAAEDRLTVFARIELFEARLEPHSRGVIKRIGDNLRIVVVGWLGRVSARNSIRKRIGPVEWLRRVSARYPVVIRIAVAATAIFATAIVYFGYALDLDPVTAFYFVATTFTSTGYGDITPLSVGSQAVTPRNPVAMVAAAALMVFGVGVIGVFIAFATSALTRAQFTALQGLRQIRTRGHVIVFGCGNVGARVVELLRAMHRRVVVVELKSDPMLEEMSSRRGIELVTGDATRDATLELCNIAHARAVIAVTDSDTANLEVALGVRARNKRVPVVMRVRDQGFAKSVGQHFGEIETHSPAALAAPVLAMISRFPETRGHIRLGEHAYCIAERPPAKEAQASQPQGCIALAVWRNDAFHCVNASDETEPSDRVLFLVPVAQLKSEPSQNGEAVAAGTTVTGSKEA